MAACEISTALVLTTRQAIFLMRTPFVVGGGGGIARETRSHGISLQIVRFYCCHLLSSFKRQKFLK